MQRKRPRERYVYVLDYLRQGNPMDKHKFHKNKPILQLLGEDYLLLLEGVPTISNIDFQLEQRIDLLSDEIQVVKIEVPITFEDLTTMAKDTLNRVLMKIINEKEKLFVEFFNRAEPLTLKLHALELLPGIGKKTLRLVLEERKKKPFETYKDIETRVGIKNVQNIIMERIKKELEGNEKYYLFVFPIMESEKKAGELVYVGYLEKLRNIIKDMGNIS
ncbi:MAG: DUF655 domain-containing protein [Sulfolobaceae archaeon]